MKINEIFQTYAPEYIQCYDDAMPAEHRKVIEAIIDCRTQSCGVAVYQCEGCGQLHTFFRSCGNTAKAARKRRIVPIANTIKPDSGLKSRSSVNYPDIIS